MFRYEIYSIYPNGNEYHITNADDLSTVRDAIFLMYKRYKEGDWNTSGICYYDNVTDDKNYIYWRDL